MMNRFNTVCFDVIRVADAAKLQQLRSINTACTDYDFSSRFDGDVPAVLSVFNSINFISAAEQSFYMRIGFKCQVISRQGRVCLLYTSPSPRD